MYIDSVSSSYMGPDEQIYSKWQFFCLSFSNLRNKFSIELIFETFKLTNLQKIIAVS
jgi:hypothetical protein